MSLQTLPLVGAALLGVLACGSGPRPPERPEPYSTICYQLHFGKWAAGDATLPFAAAPVGLHTPLPDIIALTTIPVRTNLRTKAYVARRSPQDSGQLAGSWSEWGIDSLFLVFPLFDSSAVRIRLFGSGRKILGDAWISPKEASDVLRPVPGTSVDADVITCPDSLGFERSGA